MTHRVELWSDVRLESCACCVNGSVELFDTSVICVGTYRVYVHVYVCMYVITCIVSLITFMRDTMICISASIRTYDVRVYMHGTFVESKYFLQSRTFVLCMKNMKVYILHHQHEKPTNLQSFAQALIFLLTYIIRQIRCFQWLAKKQNTLWYRVISLFLLFASPKQTSHRQHFHLWTLNASTALEKCMVVAAEILT
jgi:hypothetical protein